MTGTRNWTLCLALLALLAGCGSGEEAPRPKTTPIGGEAAAEASGEQAARSSQPAQNKPPVIRRIDLRPSRPIPGSAITAEVDAFDPDGDQFTLSYAWTVEGSGDAGDQATLVIGDVPKGSMIQLTVVARDDAGKSPAETITTRVANRPPTMLGVVIEPLDEVRADRDIAANPRAQDPDGDPLEFRYRWSVNGETVDAEGPVLAAAHYQRGDRIQLIVEATDGEATSEPLRSDPFPVVNSPPRITSTPGAFDEDGTFRYAVSAADPDGDRSLRFELKRAPEGMEIDVVSGEVAWTPTPEQAGSHPVTIEVGDRKGGVATQSFDIRVEFEEVPSPASAPM